MVFFSLLSSYFETLEIYRSIETIQLKKEEFDILFSRVLLVQLNFSRVIQDNSPARYLSVGPWLLLLAWIALKSKKRRLVSVQQTLILDEKKVFGSQLGPTT